MFNITETMKTIYYTKMLTKNGKGSPKAKLYITKEIQQFINEYKINFKDFLYIMKNNLTDFPKCQYCGKKIKNKLYNNARYCSKSCGTYATKQIKEETCLKKYGVSNFSNTEMYKKRMLTVNNNRSEKEKQYIVDKRKKTMLDRYNVEHALKIDKFKNKKNETTKKRYGVENYTQTNTWKNFNSILWTKNKKKELIEKLKKTMNLKYGTDYYSQTKEWNDKIRTTNRKKYGTDYYSQTKEWNDKIKSTNRKKYGTDYYFQSKKFLSNERKKYYNTYIKILDMKNFTMLSSKEEYLNLDNYLVFQCNLCGTKFYNNGNNIFYVYCPHCSKKLYSYKEKEVVNYIKSLYTGTIIENDRTILSGKELDIYIPDKHLAVEYNGDYWHSNLFVDENYHLDKTLACQERSIRLIHIFEYEWNTKREICQSIIASALGVYQQKIYARNCTIQSISLLEYKQFLDMNHIQGHVVSSVRLGLFYQGELVSVIGFGKSRFKKGEYELHRYCSKLYTQIIGGFSKLIKHSGVNEFISYVDRSLFDGNGYIKSGFNIVGYTKPSYVYIKNKEILRRMTCQKHKLSNILENYDETLTEEENMINNGYIKIYDCGNIKMKFSKNSC